MPRFSSAIATDEILPYSQKSRGILFEGGALEDGVVNTANQLDRI